MNSGDKIYLKCEENLFKKQFDIEGNETDELNLPSEDLEIVLKNCKKYSY